MSLPEPASSKLRWSKRRGVALASVVLGVLISLFLFQIMQQQGDPRSATSPEPLGTQGVTSPTVPEPVFTQPVETIPPDVCHLPEGNQAVPLVAPEVEWKMERKVAVPFAPATSGPATNIDGVHKCFAHNPSGALIAAAHMLSVAWQDGVGELVKNYAVESMEKASVLDVLKDKPMSPPEVAPQIKAYQIVMDNRDRARVQMVVSAQDSLIRGLLILEWNGDDWAIDPTGVVSERGEEVSDLAGYTPWGSPNLQGDSAN